MNITQFNYNWDYWYVTKKVTFDGERRLIIVNDGVASLDIRADVYSRWVDWQGLYGRDAYYLAMRYTGLDPVPGGQTGDTYFLINGWKLLIDFSKTGVTGVLFSDDYDSAYFTFKEVLQRPVVVATLVNTVNVGGAVDTDSIATAVKASLASDFAAIPTASENADAVSLSLTDMSLETALAVRAELTAELANLDASISSRLSSSAVPDVNIKYINNVLVKGTGIAGDEWGPT